MKSNQSKLKTIINEIHGLHKDEKEKISKAIKISPRCISLAVISNNEKKLFLDAGFDCVKNQKFYRPLGGGVDFGEHSSQTVVREFEEEIGKSISVQAFLGTLENIFKFEDEIGHEIVFIYKVCFSDLKDYEFDEIIVNDKGRNSSLAVWRSIDEIKAEGAMLFPVGLEELLEKNSILG